MVHHSILSNEARGQAARGLPMAELSARANRARAGLQQARVSEREGAMQRKVDELGSENERLKAQLVNVRAS